MIRSKYEAVKLNGEPRINLTRQYQPSNQLFFDTLKNKLKELIAKTKEEDNPSVDEYLPALFGVLEGRDGLVDPMLILTDHFGSELENLKI